MTIPKLLFKLRKEKQWTQQQLADRLFVSRQTYVAWEKGYSEITLAKFLLLSSIYEHDIIAIVLELDPGGSCYIKSR
jgi:transcriptional regulator with XRE-family HTH domain